MFRDDKIIALDEIVVACRDAAYQYELIVDVLEDQELRSGFRRLLTDRRNFADALGSEMRNVNHLPMAADPEKEALEGAWLRVKSAVGGKDEVILKEGSRIETRLHDSCSEALKHRYNEPIKVLLMQIQQNAEAGLRWMQKVEKAIITKR